MLTIFSLKIVIYRWLPAFVKNYIDNRKIKNASIQRIKDTIEWDKERIYKYGFRYNRNPEALLKNLRMYIHFIEKGLTMPEPHLCFGLYRLRQIADLVEEIGPQYSSEFEMQYLAKLMNEYKAFHKERNSPLSTELEEALDRITHVTGGIEEPLRLPQRHYLSSCYFNFQDGDFSSLAEIRHSVRNYIDKKISREVFTEIARIAATAPSACNRQPCHMHVISDKTKIKKIIDLGLGCRGFGELAPHMIIVTSDLICRDDITERHQVGVDAGFFGMNLLYALHEKKIGACVLNWDNIHAVDMELRALVPTLKDSETVLFMISCGYTPEEFDVPLGLKVDTKEVIDFL